MKGFTHLGGREVKDHGGSWLIPAVPAPRNLILFVHGYGGDAVRTWSMFDELLPSEDVPTADLLFHGYDGRWSELIASIGLFHRFLADLAASPGDLLNSCLSPARARPAGFQYDRIILCAHSLGAVLARGAMLMAAEDDAGWARRVKMVLFAPAHTGARVQRLLAEGYGLARIFTPLVAAYKFASPLFEQLAEGSRELSDLATQTTAMIEAGHPHLDASKILIAQRERIVYNRRFCASDPRAEAIPDTTHRTICKPRPGGRAPLDALAGVV